MTSSAKKELGVVAEENEQTNFTELQQIVSTDQSIPDGGYGYVCVACVFSINCFTWGVVATYGIFLAYYLEHDLYPDGTSFDFALIGGVAFGFTMLSTAPVNWLTGKYGVHLPMYMGVVFQTSAFIAASFAHTHIYQLYLSQGVLLGIGLGFTWLPTINIISQWFITKRSIANGFAGAGSGVGGIIFSFATRAAIANLSLGWALRIVGIVSGGMNLIATFLIRSRNKHVQPRFHPLNLKLLKRPAVSLVMLWAFVVQFGYVTIYYSLPDFASSIGLSQDQGATINAVLNIGTAFGRPLLGYFSDRYGRIEVALITTFLNALMIFAIWIPAKSYGVLIFFALINGSIVGLFWPSIGPVCGEVGHLKELPELLSLSWATVLLPLTFSEVIALHIRRPEPNNIYLYAQIFSGVSYLIAGTFLLFLWLYQKRNRKDA